MAGKSGVPLPLPLCILRLPQLFQLEDSVLVLVKADETTPLGTHLDTLEQEVGIGQPLCPNTKSKK